MNFVHTDRIDLNLFRVFVALLEEKSATRAGARLGLSQSAISHALRRLRQTVGDELFVRGPTGLRPTPRALEMAETACGALRLLEGSVTAPRFDPAADRHEFNVVASAYLATVLMPGVVRRMIVEAPHVRLNIRNYYTGAAEDLDRGRLDMMVGFFDAIPDRFAQTVLFAESGVWAMRPDHPAARAPRSLGAWPQIIVANEDDPYVPGSDLGLRRLTSWREHYDLGHDLGRPAETPVMVPDAFSALTIVSQSDTIALLPRRLALLASELGRVALVEPKGAAKAAGCSAVVRANDGAEGATGWLLGLMREAAGEL